MGFKPFEFGGSPPDWAKGTMEVKTVTNKCLSCGRVYKTLDKPLQSCPHCGSPHVMSEHEYAHDDQLDAQAKTSSYKDWYLHNLDDLEKHTHKGKNEGKWTSSWDSPIGIKNYLNSLGIPQVWFVFTLSEDGQYLALYSPKGTTFEWHGDTLTVIEDRATADHLAENCGGFVVDPFDPGCPVRIHWDMWMEIKHKAQWGMGFAWFVITD